VTRWTEAHHSYLLSFEQLYGIFRMEVEVIYAYEEEKKERREKDS
jgi:hypothetical protein